MNNADRDLRLLKDLQNGVFVLPRDTYHRFRILTASMPRIGIPCSSYLARPTFLLPTGFGNLNIEGHQSGVKIVEWGHSMAKSTLLALAAGLAFTWSGSVSAQGRPTI